jgi:hypothetical protein
MQLQQRILLMALPRETQQGSKFKGLQNCLGKKRLIVFQGVSEWPPKLKRVESSTR